MYSKIREDLMGLMEIADEQYLTIPSIRAFVEAYDLITANKKTLPNFEPNVFCSGEGDINVEWNMGSSSFFTLTVNELGVAFVTYKSPKVCGSDKLSGPTQFNDTINWFFNWR